jgi:hypothetical protein
VRKYRKGSRREIADRRDFVAWMLANGARKMEIHQRVKNQFYRQWRTVNRDIQFVRQVANKITGMLVVSQYAAYRVNTP